MEDEQAGVEDVGSVDGGIADVVDGFVDAGVGVEVGAELDAYGFAPGDDSEAAVVAGEVLCAVKGHVLEEVCEAALLGFFEYGAYFLGDVELCAVFGQVVVADVVGQAVGELSDADVLVDGEGRELHLLGCRLLLSGTQQEGCGQEGSE